MKIAPLLLAVFALAACPALNAQLPSPAQAPSSSRSNSAATDSHQGFTVSADPYTDADRAKKTFGKADPYKAGILAIDVSFKNDLNAPVHVDLSTISLDVKEPSGQHSRLSVLRVGVVAGRIAHPQGPSSPKPRHFPVPLTGGNLPGTDSKTRDMEDKLTPLSLQSDVVPPNGTLHGMIFFDVEGHFDVVPRSSLYVPDVKSVASETSMIYFEVPLGPQH